MDLVLLHLVHTWVMLLFINLVEVLNQGRNSVTNSGGGDGSGGRGDVAPLRTYYFSDIFPTEVSEIGLSYDTTDTIEEFTVTFQVQYWTAGTIALVDAC